MSEIDPFGTQRADPFSTAHDTSNVVSELEMSGLEDAREIGRGGFGVVYCCSQPRLDRIVAVKVLTASVEQENDARFVREQHVMGRLTGHPNIVNVLHVGTTASGHPYIVMPYHPRGSLETRIRSTGPLSLNETLRLGVKIAGALESAHRLGILHRDVKPANILFTDYGEPAITDFGIAHIVGGFETSTGTVTGSPAFTAPEILSGEPPSVAGDIYGLGATLFCAVSGHAAFQRRSGEELIAQFLRITTEPIPDLRELGIPEGMSAAIEHAMNGDPLRRTASAREFGEDLRKIQSAKGFPVTDMALLATEAGEESQQNSGASDGNVLVRYAGSSATTTSPPPSGNLPLELTSFIGRRRELTETKAKILESRLVTLTGIGGVGKTRLAVRVAADLRQKFDDGVSVAELGELQDASLLADLVASSLGIRDRTGPLDDVLADFLANRNVLLLLDNCEHLVDAVADLVTFLLRVCPELRILATSREPLGIGGETVLRVPPLSVPAPDRETSIHGLSRFDAITLFTDRAAAALPGFELTEGNKVTVARICQRLDGLPLPIELAAARLRSMSVEQILDRLTDRFKLLTLGSRNAPSRQQTSRLCMDWSYDLCTRWEQQLWARLSVFAGGFELDAVESICCGDHSADELLDGMASLVDKSILIREESETVVRFRMLDTLHDYGREKAEESGDYGLLRRQHRDWYRKMVLEAETEWISARQKDWIDRLGREQSNLRDAMDYAESTHSDDRLGLQIAGALFPFWLSRGLFSEGRYWLDHLLDIDVEHPTVDRIKALCASGVLAEIQGALDVAAARVAEAVELSQNLDVFDHLDLSEHLDEWTSQARVIQAQGCLELFLGDTARACDYLRKALDLVGTGDDLALRVWILNTLGMAYEANGETDQSISCHEQVLAITQRTGESVYRSYSLWSMGVAVWRQGDLAYAADLVKQALRIAERVEEPLTATVCLDALAWIAGAEHDERRAVVLMGAAEAIVDMVNSSPVLFPSLGNYRQRCEQETLRALGGQAFRSARNQGHALDFHESVAFALQENPSATGQEAGLSAREQQVADLVAVGLDNKAIADNLAISVRTTQRHIEHILTKLGFTSRSQLAAWELEQPS